MKLCNGHYSHLHICLFTRDQSHYLPLQDVLTLIKSHIEQSLWLGNVIVKSACYTRPITHAKNVAV